MDRFGTARQARHVEERHGKVRQAWRGGAGSGMARLGKARQARRGVFERGVERHSKAGMVRLGMAW